MRELWHIANSQAVVLDGYSVAVSYFPQRQSLYVLQCWHALGALKRFSWQAVDTPGGRTSAIARALRMHANYSTLLCGGEASRVIFSHAFRVARSRIHALPLPRCDVLSSPDPNRMELLAQSWPELVTSRPLVLYAPTFRDTEEDYAHWYTETERLTQALSARGVTVVIKTHFRTAVDEQSPNSTGLPPVSLVELPALINPDVDTLDLLMLADQVVTDYSAVSFEAAVAGKPLWFFIPDIEVYAEQRGLNVDPRDEMPESCFGDAEALAEAIVAMDSPHPSSAQTAFLERYVQSSSVPAAKQITRLVLKHIA
jgi:CDP-ribitol ribitolphosphotransferase